MLKSKNLSWQILATLLGTKQAVYAWDAGSVMLKAAFLRMKACSIHLITKFLEGLQIHSFTSVFAWTQAVL